MEEALIKRVLPHSLEAEQSVIGSMLMDREAVIAASEIVTGSDFYQQQYGIMFDAMVELFNEGKPVDLVTLQDRLKEKDVPPEVSSLDFVRDIVTMVPTSANVRSYATIVGEKAVLRRLIKTTEEIANTCYAGKEPLENILADTEKSVFNLLQNRGGQDFVPIKQVAINVLEKIEDAYKNQGTVTGIPSGFIDLDYKLSGFQPSDFILIAARPSMDGLCPERGGLCGGAQEPALYGVQSGDVQGAAGEPYAFHGVQCGFPEAAYRLPDGF